MTRPEDGNDASEAAAAWLVRLNRAAVDSDVLGEFFAWRRRPENAAAFARAETAWRGAGALGDDPEVRAALGQALAVPARRWPRRFGIGGALAALAAMLIAGCLWLLRPLSYETRIGEQSALRLDDGTRVRLDTGSRIEIDFTKHARTVTLVRGQALFDVAHDASKPFRVDAGVAEVHAIGTEFDVRRRPDAVSVALFEGKVGIGKPGKPATALLKPGQLVDFDASGASAPRRADRAALTGWVEGRIQFDRTPLAAAVAEVNRYTETPVILEAPALAREEVNGGFDTGDVDAFVAAVTALYPLAAERGSDGRTRLIPRK